MNRTKTKTKFITGWGHAKDYCELSIVLLYSVNVSVRLERTKEDDMMMAQCLVFFQFDGSLSRFQSSSFEKTGLGAEGQVTRTQNVL